MITFNMISHDNTSIQKIIVTGATEPQCATKRNFGKKLCKVFFIFFCCCCCCCCFVNGLVKKTFEGKMVERSVVTHFSKTLPPQNESKTILFRFLYSKKALRPP